MIDTQPYQHICADNRDGVAHVRLNRPEKLNALGIGPGSNREELLRAFAEADADPEVGCILLSGEGRSFCAGGDLGGTVQRPSDAADDLLDTYRFNDAMNRFYASIRSTGKPIIAAVRGHCLGAGLGLASQCDFLIAAEDALFGLPEGRVGQPGATELVPVIGRSWAKFLILTGELIDSTTAREIGLALTVVPTSSLLERAHDLASRVARMPREAAMLNKACIDKTAEAMEAPGRLAGRTQDIMTKFMSKVARAPDGRTFAEILKAEGMSGLKSARSEQYKTPWLQMLREDI